MLASFSFQFLYHFHLIIFNNVFLSLAALGTILNCTLSWQDEEVVLLFCLKKSCLSHAGWTVHSLNWHIWLFYILMRIFVPVIFTYWWVYLYLSVLHIDEDICTCHFYILMSLFVPVKAFARNWFIDAACFLKQSTCFSVNRSLFIPFSVGKSLFSSFSVGRSLFSPLWAEVFLVHSVWAEVFLVHSLWAEVFLVHFCLGRSLLSPFLCGQKSS